MVVQDQLNTLFEAHPLPWSVQYRRVFPSWHEQSQPAVFDANNKVVFTPPQNVRHPGLQDRVAIALCFVIVGIVNGNLCEDQK